MALSKLKPNKERIEEIAQQLKEIIEATWGKDPNLNKKSTKEFQNLKKEIEDMGLQVTWETKLIKINDPSGPKIYAEITVWIPQNITIQ